jgi:hypothetical protein
LYDCKLVGKFLVFKACDNALSNAVDIVLDNRIANEWELRPSNEREFTTKIDFDLVCMNRKGEDQLTLNHYQEERKPKKFPQHEGHASMENVKAKPKNKSRLNEPLLSIWQAARKVDRVKIKVRLILLLVLGGGVF